jgi:uncharacterized protein YecE (DUF72 family)
LDTPAEAKIGTAGWNIPRQVADRFSAQRSALERYSGRFDVAEINSSFHRSHRLSTWARWRDASPPGFRFSVKLPKAITHEMKLVGCAAALEAFMVEADTLAEKLAVLLVQLPPSLAFDLQTAGAFFAELRSRTAAAIACEPRHRTWFDSDAEALLRSHKVSRVAADPAVCEAAARPGGWPGIAYWRLHGSPAMYRSSYADRLEVYAQNLEQSACRAETWCIFDNTASSAATADALALQELLKRGSRP